MECKTYLRNVQNLLTDGKTQYELGSGESFRGQIIPFGADIEELQKFDAAEIYTRRLSAKEVLITSQKAEKFCVL